MKLYTTIHVDLSEVVLPLTSSQIRKLVCDLNEAWNTPFGARMAIKEFRSFMVNCVELSVLSKIEKKTG